MSHSSTLLHVAIPVCMTNYYRHVIANFGNRMYDTSNMKLHTHAATILVQVHALHHLQVRNCSIVMYTVVLLNIPSWWVYNAHVVDSFRVNRQRKAT